MKVILKKTVTKVEEIAADIFWKVNLVYIDESQYVLGLFRYETDAQDFADAYNKRYSEGYKTGAVVEYLGEDD
jgi:hypothetical protein